MTPSIALLCSLGVIRGVDPKVLAFWDVTDKWSVTTPIGICAAILCLNANMVNFMMGCAATCITEEDEHIPINS